MVPRPNPNRGGVPPAHERAMDRVMGSPGGDVPDDSAGSHPVFFADGQEATLLTTSLALANLSRGGSTGRAFIVGVLPEGRVTLRLELQRRVTPTPTWGPDGLGTGSGVSFDWESASRR